MGRKPYAIWKKRYAKLASLLATGVKSFLLCCRKWLAVFIDPSARDRPHAH
jgi:hypothetical protein